MPGVTSHARGGGDAEAGASPSGIGAACVPSLHLFQQKAAPAHARGGADGARGEDDQSIQVGNRYSPNNRNETGWR